MVDQTLERLSASKIARELDISPCAVNRWMNDGLCGHKLESKFIGGRRFTYRPLLDAFLQKVNETKTAAASANAAQTKEVQTKVSGRSDQRARGIGKLLEASGA